MVVRQVSTTITFVCSSLLVALIPACDVGGEINEGPADHDAKSPNVPKFEPEFDWSEIPLPATGAGVQAQSQPASPASWPWKVESFHYFSSDFIAVTQEPGNLFSPSPAGVQPLPPELSSGFFLGFEFHDEHGQIVGFGSEQELLDFDSATGKTTYTLTMPDRGSLVLVQDEQFAYLFEEINDMIAKQELVRVYDPPLVHVHTVPGTARILGGSGDYAEARGVWREISVLERLDLANGRHELGSILQIVYF